VAKSVFHERISDDVVIVMHGCWPKNLNVRIDRYAAIEQALCAEIIRSKNTRSGWQRVLLVAGVARLAFRLVDFMLRRRRGVWKRALGRLPSVR
jgi:hypothetical protein